MDATRLNGQRSTGGGLVGTVVAVLLVAGLYVGGEWFVTQDVKAGLTELLSEGRSQQVEIAAVGMDGWLLSGRRTGSAVVLTPTGERVPVEFSLTGNPVTGATIDVKGEERLRLMLRELFGTLR
ncbi:hypothetical protein [Thioalkalivibrio paradoxus]|uniref:Uncharacterized protein n=1 Tax=Thioalkalivibrio paradoxus ARh 1 TaxID=713585 RepID=W0DN74_9GAMM|nr:hypothetical protein [Thioalkalivibrio paradoxus]AHE99911.1 hypothetical protein THITH_03490 [Thioalkalivibrio paradoxus ARh 1]